MSGEGRKGMEGGGRRSRDSNHKKGRARVGDIGVGATINNQEATP